ncbi:hypothetical protein Y032_0183g926 [Ancylostoma ceylanicum]|uniref:G-protein coupled receptors family 1 profile domain-containing protein n=1 Tax=Ancylostoma ceylanicum TaxID=53326 RepID=A0A016SSN4_9BILA|nr:hypothetical protein Y032_0183g926 [Ancylostoma ceylanicum]
MNRCDFLGILLAINSVYQSVCLLSLIISIVVILRGYGIKRSDCYPMVVAYVIGASNQAPMALAISFDLLLAVLLPLRHQSLGTLLYISAILLLCWSYALFIAIYGWIMMDDDIIPFCNAVIGSFYPTEALIAHRNHRGKFALCGFLGNIVKNDHMGICIL